jgi:YD repeat-containing protein
MEAGKWTTYVYNPNDTVQSVTDAREAVATYNYNARRLITNITYSSPSGVTATPSASFQYDAVGNRTSVSDASGNVAYTYDQLSRLVMETQSFTGLSGTYHLNYTYSAGGTLTSITDEFNTTINYTHDQVGRLTAVTGAGLPSNATQLSNSIQYRAWGAVKSEAYGNGKTLAMIYDTRLQPVNYNVPGVLGGEYQYYADGALKFMHDLDLTRNGKFDRSYTYDHVGRLYEAKTGKEARGDNGAEGPYRHTYYYDAFNNVNLRDGKHWSAYLGDGWDYYANGRNTEWQYDSDGRIKQQGETLQHTFDAAGELVTSVDSTERGNGTLPRTYLQTYDGLGRAVKRNGAFATYYLKSSALGGRVIAELGSNGQRQTGYIYGNHGLLAKLEPFGAEGPVLRWIHSDAANTREAKTNPAGGSETGKQFDPLGGSVGWADHYQGGLGRGAYTGGFPDDGDPVDFSGGCTLDGVPISCSFAARLVSGASESLCLAGSCGPPRPNASTKVREKPLGKYGEYFSHSEIKRGLFARTGNAVRTDDIGDIKAAGPVLGEVTVKISFDKEIETAQALLNLRVVFETGADLAQRVLEGLKNHPGLREQIEKNIKSGLDLKTILCQAAKESNYQNLSPLPVVLKQNGGNIAVCDCV